MSGMDPAALPRQLARTRRFSLGHPTRAMVSPDGRTVFFLRSRAGDDPVGCLWAVDRLTGTERLLADPGEPAGRGSRATDRGGADPP
jgi:dipeptidyl-peptidase 4